MIKIKIPLLQIKTVAKDEEDVKVAIREAIECFVFLAEHFGKGIKEELVLAAQNNQK